MFEIAAGQFYLLHHYADGSPDHRLRGQVVKLTKKYATFTNLTVLGLRAVDHPPEIKINRQTGLAEGGTAEEGYRLLPSDGE
jgi:hypothetical protein